MSCQYSWAVIPGTDQVSASGSSDDVRDWLEPGESWFCEEHHQIALSPDDILEGYEQICLECHPDIQPMFEVYGTESDSTYLPISGAAFEDWLNGGGTETPMSWTNMSTLIGEDQSLIYVASFRDSAVNGYAAFRFIFSGSPLVGDVSGKYLYFYSKVPGILPANLRYSFQPLPFNSMTSFASYSYTPATGSEYLDYVYSYQFGSPAGGNTLYMSTFVGGGNGYKFYWSGFYLSDTPYTGDGSGSGGSGGSEPEQPGFDDPDGWLGGLIDSIIEGINEVIDGISNVATNVANLPSNIAGALSGLFQQVVSAVTSIGDQITNALTTLGNFLIDGLKQLFIPSDGYFESVVNDLSSFFSDRLGLLLYPFDFLVNLGDRIAGLETSEPACTIPEIAYTDSDDNKYVLIEGQMLNVYDLVGRNDIIVGMHQTYLTVMDGIIAFTLMALCWKRFDHIIGGGAE